MHRLLSILLIAAVLEGCSPEARTVGPSVPQTRPAGDSDPRISAYQDNFAQVSQGGRYFAWYGCSQCHTDGKRSLARGTLQFGSGFAQVYDSIAARHGALRFGERIPVEPLWQLTAYVRDLPKHTAEKRWRVQADQQAEPQGSSWSGPQ